MKHKAELTHFQVRIQSYEMSTRLLIVKFIRFAIFYADKTNIRDLSAKILKHNTTQHNTTRLSRISVLRLFSNSFVRQTERQREGRLDLPRRKCCLTLRGGLHRKAPSSDDYCTRRRSSQCTEVVATAIRAPDLYRVAPTSTANPPSFNLYNTHTISEFGAPYRKLQNTVELGYNVIKGT
jgi:hypothetical protein